MNHLQRLVGCFLIAFGVLLDSAGCSTESAEVATSGNSSVNQKGPAAEPEAPVAHASNRASSSETTQPDSNGHSGVMVSTRSTAGVITESSTRPSSTQPVSLPGRPADFPNPYYDQTEWKVWADDETPVRVGGQSVSVPPPAKRLAPIKFSEPGRFGFQPLAESRSETGLAGYWDDVYSSHDRFHSTFPKKYTCRSGEVINFADSITRLGQLPMKQAGVNFTSQSTTLMGHDIANSGERLAVIEREFYFSNVLCSAPANRSFAIGDRISSRDNYQALIPCMYNSIGASSSEVQAMAKMAIAGAYLNRELKTEMKRHGIYPACLLYLWKASLPYDVPYDHELRHRVAYYSDGLNLPKQDPPKETAGFWARAYDEQAHLEAMVRRAQQLEFAPPIPVLTLESQQGGELKYALYTTILVHQKTDQDVELVVSAARSYDIQGRDLTLRLSPICGNPGTTIDDLGDGRFRIRVPWNESLPRGRTSLLLIANNGESDSNPAVINIFKSDGDQNRRPVFEPIEAVKVLPGETVEFPVQCSDPEGFAVSMARPANEHGKLDNGRFTWQVAPDVEDSTHQATFIASDNTSGSSLESLRTPIYVRRTISTFQADRRAGNAPLTVSLDASDSRDVAGGQLGFEWDLGDGSTGDQRELTHTFRTPGVYRVRLTVAGSSGRDESIRYIEVLPPTESRVSEGWTETGLDREAWRLGHRSVKATVNETGVLSLDGRGGKSSSFLEYRSVPELPYALEMEYRGIDRRGEGLELNPNTFLGMPDRKGINRRRARGFFSVYSDAAASDGEPTHQFLNYDVNRVDFPSRLRVYVTNTTGRNPVTRISGVLVNDLGEHFFVLDSQRSSDTRIRIYSPERMTVNRFGITSWD